MRKIFRRSVLFSALALLSAITSFAQPSVDELADAIAKNDARRVSALLQQRADANGRDSFKQPVLSLAAYLGREKIVAALLANGASPSGTDIDGWNALHNAALAGHLAIAKILLDRGLDVNAQPKDGLTALAQAATRGHIRVVEALLEKGADANLPDSGGNTPLLHASMRGRDEVVRLLLQHGAKANAASRHGWTPLMAAAWEGHIASVRQLLEAGANPTAVNAEHQTALMLAESAGHREVAKALGAIAGSASLPDGSTPLHWAAISGDSAGAAALIKSGADVNATNHAGATPLHYGVGNQRVVSLLLKAGANPNARSVTGLTPLHSAAARPDAFAQVKLLLNAGAEVNAVRLPAAPFEMAQTALSMAAFQAEERTVKLLLARGAAPGMSNSIAVASAALAGRKSIVASFVERGGSVDCSDGFAGHALNIALYAQHRDLASYLLGHSIDLHQKAPFGEAVPPMVWSAYSETGDPAVTRALLDRGLDVNEPSESGSTALYWAQKRGETELVALLRSKGAVAGSLRDSHRKPAPNNPVPAEAASRAQTIRGSVQRAVTLLQRSSDGFLENGFVKTSGCVSCHHQTLPAVAFARARERGFQLDDASLARQLSVQQTGWSRSRDVAYEMQPPQPAPAAVIGYGLHGLHALRYQPDKLTAAMAWYLAETQLLDGSWPDYDVRPPMEEGQVVGTALTAKALQYFPPSAGTRTLDERVANARKWLNRFEPRDLNQRVWRYLGLGWTGASASELQKETQALLQAQRPDGGWAPLPGIECDAWATGHVLFALREAGGVSASDPAYQRGVDFLLRTQYENGSWLVKSRTWPFQPHFDSGFPHGKDQWISAGGTAWAVLALLNTIEPAAGPEDFPSAQAIIARHAKLSSSSKPQSQEANATAPGSSVEASFAAEIKPIFDRSCAACHSGEKPKGGFQVESAAALFKGGQSGEPAVIAGQPEASPLLRFVRDQVEDLEMPPLSRRGKYPALTTDEIQKLRRWIEEQRSLR